LLESNQQIIRLRTFRMIRDTINSTLKQLAPYTLLHLENNLKKIVEIFIIYRIGSIQKNNDNSYNIEIPHEK